MTIAVASLALAVGVAMGIFGGGGSLLLVPALTSLMGFDAKRAVTTSLAVVGIAALAGSVAKLAQGKLPIKPAIVIGTAAVLGALVGSAIGARLDDRIHLQLFSAVVVVAAIALAWQSWFADAARTRARGDVALAAAGAGVGVLTGLLGVGGGFLIAPALVMGANLEMREAANVSLFVVVLATAAAFVGYAGSVTPDWSFVMPFAATASVGTVAGGFAAQSIPQRRLQQIFAAGLIVVAVVMAARR